MFKYDKVVSKLEKFGDLSKEKQVKLLRKVLTNDEALEWQFDPGKNRQPYTGEMVQRFYKLLAYPTPMKMYPVMMEKYGKSDFTRSSISVLNMILTFAIEANNEMVRDLKAEINENGNGVEAKDMRSRAEKYAERLDELKDIIQKLAKPYLKDLSKDTGLSRDIIFRSIIAVPETKYIQKHRIASMTIHLLEELYSEAAATGFPNKGAGVRWKPLFKELFGVENLPSVAVSILLEGNHHIDQYRDSENLDAVRDCWDSITKFALDQLEKSPDQTRTQMIELYLKKAENLIARRNGRPTDLRVNLTRLPREFSNLIRTVDLYKSNFESIYNKVRYDRGHRDESRGNRAKEERGTEDGKSNILDSALDVAKGIASIFDTEDE